MSNAPGTTAGGLLTVWLVSDQVIYIAPKTALPAEVNSWNTKRTGGIIVSGSNSRRQ